MMELLRVEELTVEYAVDGHHVKAVDDVSLTVDKGGALGVVGESGCGKSTLALAVMGILPDNARITSGRIQFEGEDLLKMPQSRLRRDIRWSKISMIFQSSMNALNPVYRVGSTLASVAKFKRKASREEATQIVERLYHLVDMDPSRMKNYPHQYSGGMRQRAVIAMSLICEPALIIADEPTTALDVVVQNQILKTLRKLREDLGISIILISHDVGVIGETCEEVAVMYGGKLFETGSTKQLFSKPNNPYTRALLGCFPNLENPKSKLNGIPGEPPDLTATPPGCRFAPRCAYAKEVCRTQIPPLYELEPGHQSLCHFAGELSH
jgi:peptide/nickel transport system ATP-binding protein